jgi:hypothetical protein
MVYGHRGFDQTGYAGGSLGVSNIRLDCAQDGGRRR